MFLVEMIGALGAREVDVKFGIDTDIEGAAGFAVMELVRREISIAATEGLTDLKLVKFEDHIEIHNAGGEKLVAACFSEIHVIPGPDRVDDLVTNMVVAKIREQYGEDVEIDKAGVIAIDASSPTDVQEQLRKQATREDPSDQLKAFLLTAADLIKPTMTAQEVDEAIHQAKVLHESNPQTTH